MPFTQVIVLRGYRCSTRGRSSTRRQSKDPLRVRTYLKMLSTFGKAISRVAEKNFAWRVTPETSVERVSNRKIGCSFADGAERIAIARGYPNGMLLRVLHAELRHV